METHVIFDGDSDAVVHCDPAPLSAALNELVDNCRRHGISPMTVDVRQVERQVTIRVSDAGQGPPIEPDTPLDHTWDLFENPEVMPKRMGDRLGITFAYALVEGAGGHLRFERHDRQWAFVLEFPAEPSNGPRADRFGPAHRARSSFTRH